MRFLKIEKNAQAGKGKAFKILFVHLKNKKSFSSEISILPNLQGTLFQT